MKTITLRGISARRQAKLSDSKVVTIRREIVGHDLPAILRINERAFAESGGSYSFADLRNRDDVVSLVAVRNNQVFGHVLFTPTALETDVGDIPGMGLVHLAVDPDQHRKGIGKKLVLEGINILKALQCPYIIVIGVIGYYPQFGFRPGSTRGFKCQWKNIGDESFMVLILNEEKMRGATGVARYIDSFN